MKQRLMKIKNRLVNFCKFIDKKVIIPITKIIIKLSETLQNSNKVIEPWLSKQTTLLYLSLFLALATSIIIDQKILVFTENSAEVLKDQEVKVLFNDETYVVEGLPEDVDVTLIGSRTDLYIAKQSSSGEITVDLTGLKPGTHEVDIEYSHASSSIEYSVNPSVATVIIYEKVSEPKTLSTDILNINALDSKLVIDNVNIENDTVIVKGAQYQLDKVASVKALIDVNNFISQEVGTLTVNDIPLKAYDADGNVVDVEIVPNKITADVVISSPQKVLTVKVIPEGEVAFGKAISEITLSEQKVTVYGAVDVLNQLTEIPVYINVEDLDEDRNYKVELEKPVGVNSMSTNTINIDIKLDKEVTKELEGINIEYENIDTSIYKVQGLSESDVRVSVTLKGVESVLDTITAENVKVYLDLNEYNKEGEYEVEVLVSGTDPKVQYIPKTTKVKIQIIRK